MVSSLLSNGCSGIYLNYLSTIKVLISIRLVTRRIYCNNFMLVHFNVAFIQSPETPENNQPQSCTAFVLGIYWFNLYQCNVQVH